MQRQAAHFTDRPSVTSRLNDCTSDTVKKINWDLKMLVSRVVITAAVVLLLLELQQL